MKNMPRILPLVGVAIGGVLAINALAGAKDLPSLLSGARAYAEEAAVKATKAAKGAKTDKAGKPGDPAAPTGEAKDVAAVLPPPTITPKAVCAPTAAELAKEAGLSPAELQVLQSLGSRRGELDRREEDLSTQLGLMAAAEAKLDAKVKALNGLKADVQSLLAQANGREATEVDRLVKVFEGMKAKDAAPRMVLLDDSVRLPIAAKMKERALSAIIAQMPPPEAKRLTESLSRRFSAAQALAQQATQAAQTAADPAPKAADAKAQPVRQVRKAPPRKKAPASKQASAGSAPAASAAPTPAAPPAATPAAAPPPPKAG
jgi:flagellar motility protein MotE (MotC chaperone)